MRTPTPGALVVIVVLAGCSGLPVIGTESDQVTVTPADVPTEAGSGMPPGVTDTGIDSVQTLIDAHQDTLANRSVTANMTRQIVVDNRTVKQVNTTIRIAGDRTSVSTVSNHTSTGVDTKRETWTNETDFYSKRTQNGTNTYRHYDTVGESLSTERSNRWLLMNSKSHLSDISNVSVEPLSDNTSDRYLLTGTRQADRQAGFPDENMTIQDGHLSAVIDGSGFIRGYEYEQKTQNDTTTTRITTEVQFHRNTSPPERPAWVNEAANATRNETAEQRAESE